MGSRLDISFNDPLRGLPVMFTYTDAHRAGVSDRTLYQLRDSGMVEAIGRGIYQRADAAPSADIDLLEIARRAARATLCLTTALARHGLTDDIPAHIDVALPRGQHRPVTTAPVSWHLFDPRTFEIGRTELELDQHTSVGLYGPERSIVDAFRLRHREGPDLANTALKRWLRRPESVPSRLLSMAQDFPQADRALRGALEILL